MSKTDLVRCLLKHYTCNSLLPIEKLLLEIRLFTYICQELSEIFKSQYKTYQQLIKSNLNLETSMPSVKFMK